MTDDRPDAISHEFRARIARVLRKRRVDKSRLVRRSLAVSRRNKNNDSRESSNARKLPINKVAEDDRENGAGNCHVQDRGHGSPMDRTTMTFFIALNL
jgi:hypothetical protein